MKNALTLAQDTTTTCPSCKELGYLNIMETMSGEVWYYTEQLGIDTPGLREFINKLMDLGLY